MHSLKSSKAASRWPSIIGLTILLLLIWTSLTYIRGPQFFYSNYTSPKHPSSASEDTTSSSIQPSTSSTPSPPPPPPPPPPEPPLSPADHTFLNAALLTEFPHPFDPHPLSELCHRPPISGTPHFRPALLFTCVSQHGGIGMVRNQLLKCLRYAVSAGASIVLPVMSARNPTDITDIETANKIPLSAFFDVPTFKKRLEEACPEMGIYGSAEEFPGLAERVIGADGIRDLLLTGDAFDKNHPRTGLRYPREWRTNFDSWLLNNHSINVNTLTPSTPLHILLGQSYLEYPIFDDGPAFSNNFGKLLPFRLDTQELSARVLLELKKQHNLQIDPSRAINANAYFGAHLRLEKDAVEAWAPEEGWKMAKVATQFEAVYNAWKGAGSLDVIYVASGNQTIVAMFEEFLHRRIREEETAPALSPSSSAAIPSSSSSPNPPNDNLHKKIHPPTSTSNDQARKKKTVAILTKHTLLAPYPTLTTQLNSMTFDQQALVDFTIMFKASYFAGVAYSSFPWTVALRRHVLSGFEEFVMPSAEGKKESGSGMLRDGVSEILGMRSDYPYVDPFEFGLWP